jgi:hypothetical protein
LHQTRNQTHTRATAVQRGDHAGDLRSRLRQAVDVCGCLDLHRDEVGVVGQEAEQIQGFQYAHDMVAIHHDQAVHTVTLQQSQGIAHLVRRTHGNDLEVGEVAYFLLL